MIRKKIFHLALSLGLFMGLSAAPLAGAYTNPDGTTATYDITADPATNAEYNENYENEGTINARAGKKNGTVDEYGGGLLVEGNFVNRGTINTHGELSSAVTGNDANRYGTGIAVFNGSFENNGTITATARDKGNGIWVRDGNFVNNVSGIIHATGTGNTPLKYGSSAINAYKGFLNYGTIIAKGEGYRGYGIYVQNDASFRNYSSGIIDATGTGVNGAGIGVYDNDFVNEGKVTARGVDGGAGIYLDGFLGGEFVNTATGTIDATGSGLSGRGLTVQYAGIENSGSLRATAKDGGFGVAVQGGDFENAGVLTLDGDGTGASIRMLQIPTAGTTSNFTLQEGSTLVVQNGGNIAFEKNPKVTGDTGTFTVEDGAKIVVQNASTLGTGGSASGTFISGASSITGLSELSNEGAVFNYTFNANGGYTVTRNAYASSLLNGLPRNLVAGLENSFAGKDLPDADDPAAPWLNMLTDIENQASTADVQAAAAQYADSHINSYAAPAFGGALRISRISADYFQNNVLGTLSGREQPAFGQTDSGFSVWLTPFYQKGELDVRGRSDMDEEFYGMTMGMGKTWSNWTLAGGIHLLDSDFDGDRFNADAKGYGFDLALATRLNLGGFAPRLVLSTSYSTHDFDQYRLVHNPTTGQNERYFADYDVDVYTVGVKVDNDFQLSGNMVLRAGLGLDYASADLDNYQESGDYAQSVRGGDYDSLRAQLSLDLDITLIDGFVLTPRAAAFYEFCDTEATLTSTAVGLPGLILDGPDQDPSRASGRAGLALSYHLVEHLDLSASYDYYFGADRTAHEAGLTLGIKF